MCNAATRLPALLLLLFTVACSKPDYTTLAGDSGRFSDLHGRWVLINYWAEWCKPCIKEFPELNQFQRENGERATLFVVNFDGVSNDQLAAQISRFGIEVPALTADPAPLLGYERPKALPTTIVIGPDGKLRQVLQGPQTAASLAAIIDERER